ncbi:unnamed protein product, partial [Rotaria magnacalcarata]
MGRSLPLCQTASFRCHSLSGENAHGGVLAMVRKDISAVGVSCSLPNICALDLQFDQTIRLLAV